MYHTITKSLILLLMCAALTLTLSGCVTFNTNKDAITAFEEADTMTDCKVLSGEDKKICTSRNAIKKREKEYGEFSRELKNENSNLFDYPLIGIAAASAASLFYGASTDVIGGLGIGAGTILGFKTYTSNTERSVFYRSARKGLSCIYIHSNIFMNSDSSFSIIQSTIEQAQLDIDRANELLPDLEPGSKEKETLDGAIVSAEAAIKLGEDAKAAIKGCVVTIYETAESIHGTLESELDGIMPDISQIISTIEASAKTESETDAGSEKLMGDVAHIETRTAILKYENKVAFRAKTKSADVKKKEEAVTLAGKLSEFIKAINKLAPDYIKANSDIKKCAAQS